jgi:hypothetical protein
MRAVCAWLLCAAAAACTGTPQLAHAFDLAPARAMHARDFPAARSLVDAFLATNATAPHLAGHTAVFGVEIHRDGTLRRRLLQIDMPPEPLYLDSDATAAPLARTTEVYLRDDAHDDRATIRRHAATPRSACIRQFEVDGRPIGDSVLQVYDEVLPVGLWGLAAGDTNDRDHAHMLLWNLQQLVNADRRLQELLFEVLDPPGLWSVATHFGVDVSTTTEPRGALPQPWPDPVWGTAAACLRATIAINDATAVADLVLAQPGDTRPASLGVCAAVVRCGSDPERLLAVRLLAIGSIPDTPPGRTSSSRPWSCR